MPNELKFDVRFEKAEIQEILNLPNAAYIIVSGTYKYNGKKGWKMNASAQGAVGKNLIGSPIICKCIQPCSY